MQRKGFFLEVLKSQLTILFYKPIAESKITEVSVDNVQYLLRLFVEDTEIMTQRGVQINNEGAVRSGQNFIQVEVTIYYISFVLECINETGLIE